MIHFQGSEHEEALEAQVSGQALGGRFSPSGVIDARKAS